MRWDFLLLVAGVVVIALAEAVLAAEPRPLMPLSEYVECGCGCCAGVEPVGRCLYRSKGDSLERVAQESKKNAPSAQTCPIAGCAPGVRYRYCD